MQYIIYTKMVIQTLYSELTLLFEIFVRCINFYVQWFNINVLQFKYHLLLDIVHRDIKLENILLINNPADPSDKYFIKLTDFGLSIIKTGAGIQSMLKEYCGTIIYMGKSYISENLYIAKNVFIYFVAPEILLQHSYSELCDVWSIGVILYKLLFREYPFFSNNEEELSNKICTSNPVFQTSDKIAVSYEAIDLIKCLLQKDPATRITALEILQHPWLVENKIKQKKGTNVLEYMKQWKSEMKVIHFSQFPQWGVKLTLRLIF